MPHLRSVIRILMVGLLLGVPTAIVSCGSEEPAATPLDDGSIEPAPAEDGAVVPPSDAAGDVATDATSDDAATPKLIVHSREAWVILGDGSKFRQKPVDGVAVFDRPEGAVDVSEIRNTRQGGQITNVTTYASVMVSEVWLPSSYAPEIAGRIRGTVEGVADGGLQALTPGDAGYTLNLVLPGRNLPGVVSDAGTFNVERRGTPQPYNVTAVAIDNQTHKAFRFGVVTNVPADPDGGDMEVEIPMDRTFTDSVTIEVTNGGDRRNINSAVRYSAPNAEHFEDAFTWQRSVGTAPVPIIDRRPPLDGWTAWADVSYYAHVLYRRIPPGTKTLTVTAPEPPTLIAPVVSPSPPYPEGDVSGLRWKVNDPDATLVRARVMQASPTPVEWTVYAPSSAGTFALFTIPTDISKVPFFSSGRDVVVVLTSYSMEKITSAQDFYGHPRGIDIPQTANHMGMSGVFRLK